MIDAETVRVAALGNRVPTAVLVLEVVGSALALALLAAYLALAGRGVLAVSLASVLVAFLLLVTADLDRPTRGMIRVPDTALTNELASMASTACGCSSAAGITLTHVARRSASSTGWGPANPAATQRRSAPRSLRPAPRRR